MAMVVSSGFFACHHNKVLANRVFCSSTPAALSIAELSLQKSSYTSTPLS